MRTKDIVVIGGVAIAGYLIWKFFNKVGSAGDSVLNAIAKPIADAYVGITSGPSVQSQLQGQVIMPDGSNFSTSELQTMNFGFQGNVATFISNGVQYSLSPHDANGNYVATRV